MILYENSGYSDVIYRYKGTVWKQTKGKCILVAVYVTLSYIIAEYYQVNFGTEGRTILVSTMCFLLIFRANQSYSRYWQGRSQVSMFFSDIREFIMLSMLYCRGGIANSTYLFHGGGIDRPRFPFEDGLDQKARECRIDIIRLAVSLAVSFKLYTRICFEGFCFGAIDKESKWKIDFDRLRLLQLMTRDEFRLVDESLGILTEDKIDPEDIQNHLTKQFQNLGEAGPPESWPNEFEVNMEPRMKPPMVLLCLMREVMLRNMNEFNNNVPWGIKERWITPMTGLITSMQHSFEFANQIITTPLPLPYANLCKTLLSVFLLSLPFLVDYAESWFVNTCLTCLIAFALLGIDAIATELENPFGDDDNDLDILELIHVLECEAIMMLSVCGDDKGVARFCWRRLPDFVEEASCKPLRRQLAVKDFAGPEIAHANSVESLASCADPKKDWSGSENGDIKDILG